MGCDQEGNLGGQLGLHVEPVIAPDWELGSTLWPLALGLGS